MRSAQRLRLLAILLAAISTRLLASSAPLRINESEMSAVISEREIALIAPVSNESETAVSGTLYVDLLDPKDAVVASSKTTEHLKPGRSLIKLSLPRPAIPVVADNDPVLWYRVKYRLLLDDKQAAKRGWLVRPVSSLLRLTIGYGYFPMRALWWLLALVVVGAFVYSRGYDAGSIVPTQKDAYDSFVGYQRLPGHYQAFHALPYSLENSFPLVKLGIQEKWMPGLGGPQSTIHRSAVGLVGSLGLRRRTSCSGSDGFKLALDGFLPHCSSAESPASSARIDKLRRETTPLHRIRVKARLRA